MKQRILDKISLNLLEIIQSPFGNYAIQFVFEVKIYLNMIFIYYFSNGV